MTQMNRQQIEQVLLNNRSIVKRGDIAELATALQEGLARVDDRSTASTSSNRHCDTCTCNCTCGYGGFHEPENARCELNQAGA